MRRYALLILFVLVLLVPLALAPSRRQSSSSQRIVIVTPHVEGIKREFADAFNAWHQERFGSSVTIDYRSYGGASEIVRYFQSEEEHYKRFGTYRIDLVWGGGDFLFDEQLKKPGYLEGVELPREVIERCYPQRVFNGIPLYDASDPPQWFGAALSSFGIVYNRDVLKYLNVAEPRRWQDLADARLGGWFISGDPTRSGSARQVFMIVVERAMLDATDAGRGEDAGWAEGMGLIRLICSNARYFTDAGSSVPNVISTGDAAAGMAIDFYGRAQVDAVGSERLNYIEPVGETAINADPIALVRGAEHRELAVRFIEFVLSERNQRLWNTRAGATGGPKTTSLRRLPIMRSVYDNPADFTDRVNPFDERFAFRSSPRLMKTFPILGELIEVSCMNLLEELRETRRAIVASPRRAELEKRLGTFPFDQKEALARQQAYFDRSTSAIQRLEMKRRWLEQFRDEYRTLREEAGR
jgi:ABC-type Fe3+ transport system substrate-binding protein